MDAQPIFTVFVPYTPPVPDVLDLWQVNANDEAYQIGGEKPGSIWRADLPNDMKAAARALNTHAVQLKQTSRALTAAGSLLSSDLQQVNVRGGSEATYDLEASGITGRQALLAFAFNYDPEQVEYNSQVDKLQLDATAAWVSRFAWQVRSQVEQFALVASVSGGRQIGLTRVVWTGDMQTWWNKGSSSALVDLHRQLLAQAIASRQAWLRLLLTIMEGAVKVGLSLTTGPFSLIAIWTAFNYVRKVIEQYRQLGAP